MLVRPRGSHGGFLSFRVPVYSRKACLLSTSSDPVVAASQGFTADAAMENGHHSSRSLDTGTYGGGANFKLHMHGVSGSLASNSEAENDC